MGVIGLYLVLIRVIAGSLDNSFGIVCALILVNPQKAGYGALRHPTRL
jgi:hypothetical protein